MSTVILAIDQGTTGSTAVLLSCEDASVVARANREFPQHYPQAGWVEHDLAEIWESVEGAIEDALQKAKLDSSAIAAIGITNQRETTIVWDRATGEPIHRAIVWQDRRTAEMCAKLKSEGLEERYKSATGLVLDPYFSGTKVRWILDAVDGAQARAERGELCFGTIDSWLVFKLSGGAAHVTDASNASRTLLYDIRKGAFTSELCEPLNVPMGMLPSVEDSAKVYAKTAPSRTLPAGIPIAGMAGDQQAALFGQTCFAKGEAKCTYGTGAFLLMNIGDEVKRSEHGLVTTVAWQLGGKVTYALEGSSFIAGAAVQWLRDGLGLIKSAPEIEGLAEQVDDAGDVVFVPALAGLGAPHWNPHARGLISGLSRDSSAAHLARACLDGIAMQVRDLAEAMRADAGHEFVGLRVDGGAAMNNLLMQLQADALGVSVSRPENVETTALGAAYLAGLGAGIFEDLAAIQESHVIDRTFTSGIDENERSRRTNRWEAALAKSQLGTES